MNPLWRHSWCTQGWTSSGTTGNIHFRFCWISHAGRFRIFREFSCAPSCVVVQWWAMSPYRIEQTSLILRWGNDSNGTVQKDGKWVDKKESICRVRKEKHKIFASDERLDDWQPSTCCHKHSKKTVCVSFCLHHLFLPLSDTHTHTRLTVSSLSIMVDMSVKLFLSVYMHAWMEKWLLHNRESRREKESSAQCQQSLIYLFIYLCVPSSQGQECFWNLSLLCQS